MNEQIKIDQRDCWKCLEAAFLYYNVELPKTLRDKLYPPQPE